MEKIKILADKYMQNLCSENPDPSHDILHVRRVVKLAEQLCRGEGGDINVITPAAYLHDCVYISKTDQRRSQASQLSAEKAVQLLREWGEGSEGYLDKVYHAVEAHSFSAGVKALSLEAQIVQDADRLDAMGAVGIARAMVFSGLSKRPIYHEEEPFCGTRVADDTTNTLDHFFVKLLKLQERLNTDAAKKEGERRLSTMQAYIDALKGELL